ncbi:hypothetical protein MPER_08647, partial [Moniliophthora perniciosa FA553]
MEELQELIHLSENSSVNLTTKQQERLERLTDAAITLGIEDHIKIHSIPDIDDDEYEAFLEEDRQALEEFIKTMKDIPVNFGNSASDVNALEDLNVNVLVKMRERHQTYHAARAIRTHGKSDIPAMEDAQNSTSLRKQIISAFHTELKLSQDRGMTTGDGRSKRWTGKEPELTGNAANAVVVAQSTGREAAGKRRRIFLTRKVPHFNDCLESARVSKLRPLKIGDFGFVYMSQGIFLSKVITCYSKGGGKHGKHCAVTSAENVSALSYIAVQLFEHIHGGIFRPTPSLTATLQLNAFALISSSAFLTITPATRSSQGNVRLPSAEELTIFKDLQASHKVLGEAMKDFKKR